MSKENRTEFQEEAEQAAELEAQAKAQPDAGAYIHKLKKPFTRGGRTVEELTFDWDSLTGRDYDAIEGEIVRAGGTLILPEYTGLFLSHMAVRACTDRDENGMRLVDKDFLAALPLREYKAILGKARFFLLHQA